MIRILFYPVTIIIFLIVQMVAVKYLKFQDVCPDIFLLGTIYFAIKRGPVSGMSFGFFSGLLQDAFIMGPFGANALVKTLVGFLAGLFQKKIYEDSIIAQAGLVFVFSFLYYWSILFLQFLFGQFHYTRPFLQPVIFSVYNGIVAPVIFTILRFWEKKNVAGHGKFSEKNIS